jgi:hypothetical protein
MAMDTPARSLFERLSPIVTSYATPTFLFTVIIIIFGVKLSVLYAPHFTDDADAGEHTKQADIAIATLLFCVLLAFLLGKGNQRFPQTPAGGGILGIGSGKICVGIMIISLFVLQILVLDGKFDKDDEEETQHATKTVKCVNAVLLFLLLGSFLGVWGGFSAIFTIPTGFVIVILALMLYQLYPPASAKVDAEQTKKFDITNTFLLTFVLLCLVRGPQKFGLKGEKHKWLLGDPTNFWPDPLLA